KDNDVAPGGRSHFPDTLLETKIRPQTVRHQLGRLRRSFVTSPWVKVHTVRHAVDGLRADSNGLRYGRMRDEWSRGSASASGPGLPAAVLVMILPNRSRNARRFSP